jgi:hypothetical protein
VSSVQYRFHVKGIKMYKSIPPGRSRRYSSVNSLNLLLLVLALFSVTAVIIYEVKFLVADFLKKTDKKENVWNNFNAQLINTGFITDGSKNLSQFDQRLQKVKRLKVLNLFNDMKGEKLGKYLKNFYLEGEKRYSVVLSSWRSGSSFFGDFLQSVPGTFYHYEPLINNVKMIRPPNDVYGIKVVENFLDCNYENTSVYFEFMRRSYPVFNNPLQLRNIYQENKDIAIQANFVAPICKIYPFQSMKVIRLGLESFKSLLRNNEMNVKVILLVRDPRAVMNSRSSLKFCMDTPDCAKPEILCKDMVDDFHAAVKFTKQYPHNLK